MKIEIETGHYNEKRYGKPWIALVTFSDEGEINYEFGKWIGTAGYNGILQIDVEAGAIVARGQRDYRGKNNDINFLGVEADGTLSDLGCNKANVYRAYQQRGKAAPVDERAALLAEREALLARLAEIDAALGDAVPAAPAPAPTPAPAPAPARRKARPAPAAALILLGQLPLFPALFGF